MGTTSSGRKGEQLAASYLKRKGYAVIANNYRRTHGEVDIIAKDGETLVFVEVKSRKNGAFGNPIDAVNPVKQKRLQFMARQYMAERELCHVNVRFDIVEILWGDTAKQAVKIHHVKNAF